MSKFIFKGIDIKDIGKPLDINPPEYEEEVEEEKGKEDEEEMKEKLDEELEEKVRVMEEELGMRRMEFEKGLESRKEELELWLEKRKKEGDELYRKKVKELEELEVGKEAARRGAEELIEKARLEIARNQDKAYKKGYEEGMESGYEKGQDEVKRLIGRLNVVISSAVKRRNEIIEESESQIVDIIITIARKIVKSITEVQRRVVYDNVCEALKMLKARTEVTIRVNMEDLEMVTKHKQIFIDMVEGIEHLKILEDNSVDRGGCYIDTDFGSINAKISTQLSNIEEQIKKIVPVSDGEYLN